MMAYEKKVDDYSFGTMLRSSPKEEYTQHGTIFGKSACQDSCFCPRSRCTRTQGLPKLNFTGLSGCHRPCQLGLREGRGLSPSGSGTNA